MITKYSRFQNGPRPLDAKDLRSWMGLKIYYSKYLLHMATTAAHLYNFLKSKVPFEWSEEFEQAFNKVKELTQY